MAVEIVTSGADPLTTLMDPPATPARLKGLVESARDYRHQTQTSAAKITMMRIAAQTP